MHITGNVRSCSGCQSHYLRREDVTKFRTRITGDEKRILGEPLVLRRKTRLTARAYKTPNIGSARTCYAEHEGPSYHQTMLREHGYDYDYDSASGSPKTPRRRRARLINLKQKAARTFLHHDLNYLSQPTRVVQRKGNAKTRQPTTTTEKQTCSLIGGLPSRGWQC
ncbi:hypothetical protein ACJ73_07136 [Blastomyces percursus]|uniref:Uncharacterized protein n=1 Tax=Blastomyces percursus TaxID=1658174 RepID=A0A1J9PYY0_9EURO|nr:hypothetical protein ACJ73_07136 [Blastomyces percursus]